MKERLVISSLRANAQFYYKVQFIWVIIEIWTKFIEKFWKSSIIFISKLQFSLNFLKLTILCLDFIMSAEKTRAFERNSFQLKHYFNIYNEIEWISRFSRFVLLKSLYMYNIFVWPGQLARHLNKQTKKESQPRF